MDILFAEGSKKEYTELPKETVKDLAVEEITSWMSVLVEERSILTTLMSRVLKDPEDMRYRQEIFQDLINDADLRDGLYEAVSKVRSLKEMSGANRVANEKDNGLYTILQELRSISLYADTVRFLSELLNTHEVRSRGLLALKEEMDAICKTEKFTRLGEDVKKMMDDISTVRSAVIGVNFTPDLDIESIAAVDFQPFPAKSRYSFINFAAGIGVMQHAGQGAQSLGMNSVNSVKYKDPLLVAMMPMMEKHLKKHFTAVRKVIAQYRDMDVKGITDNYEGLVFYTCCSRYGQKLQERGYGVCTPK